MSDLIDLVAPWLHAFDGSPLICDEQLVKQREAYRARATQVVAVVRKFDAPHDDRVLLCRQAGEDVTTRPSVPLRPPAPPADIEQRLSQWRTRTAQHLGPVALDPPGVFLDDPDDDLADGFEANGEEYEKSGASDPGRQYELAAAALAWREEILNPPPPAPLAPGDTPF